jgi:mRNA-degrading endonuclease RelE of RelBE toxin-antitoxin system
MLFIETPIFTQQIKTLLPDDEYRLLQLAIAMRPEAAPVIRDSGGLRKLRWAAPGRGKRGGIRIIYQWVAQQRHARMLLAYPKSRKDDLCARELRILRALIQNWDPLPQASTVRH